MRSLRFLSLFLLPAALIVVGCGEQDSPTDPGAEIGGGATPRYSLGGPGMPGNSPVVRVNGSVDILTFDDSGTYWTLHTTFPVFCGGPLGEFLSVEQQVILSPSDETVLMQIQQGEHNVFLGSGAFSCANGLAYGIGSLHLHDNDLLAFMDRRTNAFGYTSQSTLQTLDGGTVTVKEISHCTWDTVDFATFKCKNKINVE